MNISIIGAPFNGDGTPLNIENPADALRQAGLVSLLSAEGHEVVDCGDLPIPTADDHRDEKSGILNLAAWQTVSDRLSDEIQHHLDNNRFLLILGGDCGILIGIAAAFHQASMPLGLIFLDGHADFHMPQESPEGELADMELAMLTGYAPQPVVAPSGKSALLEPENVAVFGIRAHEGIAQAPIAVFDHQQMQNMGIMSAVGRGLKPLLEKNLPLWLNFDVDVIDPEYMPVVFPEPGGLSITDVTRFLNLVTKTGRVVGMSVTCFHPNLDRTGQSAARLVEIIANGLEPSV